MFHNIGALHHTASLEAPEGAASRRRTPWYGTRCWRVFIISLSFTGFMLCFAFAFYFLLVERKVCYYSIFPGIIFLTVFINFVSEGFHSVHTARPMSAVPVRIASGERFREVLRRTESERGSSLVPEREDFFHSLPAYILIPTERQDRDESSNASTESTLSAESTKRHEEESELIANPQKQQVLNKPATSGPCGAAKLSEAAAVISEIVKDAILDKEDNASTVATTAVEQSSDNSSEKGKEANKEGVRQRKPTPMEAQEYIPLAEDLIKK